MHHFQCDYAAGAHPRVIEALSRANCEELEGYGADYHTRHAEELILKASGLTNGAVYFVSGGTQANLTLISSVIKVHEAVVCADCGHIQTQETSAVEATGHKILLLPNHEGKVCAKELDQLCEDYIQDENRSHLAKPGLLYISFPSETGSIYTLSELEALSEVCHRRRIFFYLDGARLAYGLAASSDVTLADIARLTDAFYIGATKCGGLFAEAIVFNNKENAEDFHSNMRMRGALLARGWTLSVQFEALFETGLYFELGANAVSQSQRILATFRKKGIPMIATSETNQQFPKLTLEQVASLKQKCNFRVCANYPDGTVKARFCTCWATTEEIADELIAAIREL